MLEAYAEGMDIEPFRLDCILSCIKIQRRWYEISGASEASQVQSIPAVRFDPITSLLRNAGGRHPPAVVVFFPQIPREPGATGASLRDKDEAFGFRWPLTDAVIDGTLACPHGAQGSDLGHALGRQTPRQSSLCAHPCR